jgi:predicted TPR repeat methyltransferase
VSAFSQATAAEPGEAPGWLGLALSLEADGRAAEAAAALERYLALQPAGQDADNVRARIARLRASAEPSSTPPDAGNGPSRRLP